MKFEEIKEKVANGARFSVNLKERTIRLNGKLVEFETQQMPETKDDVIPTMREFYNIYKHSQPSERSESRYRTYFSALKEKDLSDEDMLYGVPRELARFDLEMTILEYAINGVFDRHWDEWFKSVFYQDGSFILMKDWVVSTNKNKQNDERKEKTNG